MEHTDHSQWANTGVEQGGRRLRAYRGYGPTYYGSVTRVVERRFERVRCCGWGHATRKAARECGGRKARELKKEVVS